MTAGPASLLTATALALLLAGCSRPTDAPVAPQVAAAPHDVAGIAWKQAATDADVDAAFAQARAQSKPVFVYWGAKWCPPCNQVKATIFNRQDFIERSRGFVPVYIDGDSPGAQRLGARFKVSGYPTMVLFNPQGAELTRLPGEVEAERYTQVLTLGMNAQRPVKEVLAAAQAGGAGLQPNDWRLLAFYSWGTDQTQLVPKEQLPALLARLAAACPADQVETADRLRLMALAAADGKEVDPSAQPMVLRVLRDPAASRAFLDLLTNEAPDIVRAVTREPGPARAELLAAFDTTLKRLENDTTLSRADRMTALIAQVDLATIDSPKRASGRSPPLPTALLDDIRTQAARADREITDGYERQSVITTAAYLLQHAGLAEDSDALLEANLARSHSPYYLMSQLASNAKARGDKAGALDWYGQAFAKSEGPATRLQWGASYLNALVDMAPQDEARIEKTAGALFDEAARQPDAFYERSGRSLQRVGTRLQAWNESGAHGAVLRRLQSRLDGVCATLAADDAKRTACRDLLKKPAGKTST